MDFHSISFKEALKVFNSSEKGLEEEQAKKRINEYGKNEIKEEKSSKKIILFLKQFNSLLILILIAAAIVSALINHLIDSIVISVIILLNVIIGFIQEKKADDIIEKLRKSLNYKVIVIRGGIRKEIDSRFLVPGDIILVSSGDKVLADCRIIEAENLSVNESILTGESFPVDKKDNELSPETLVQERSNILFAGTTITKGKATALVIATGNNSNLGNLAKLVKETKSEKTPLEKKLDSFSRKLSLLILLFVSITFLLGVYYGLDKLEMFLVSVSLAVGTIPEGLPAIITITLAFAVKEMYKSNTLIRRLPAAETLGRATVICTDKTGTITMESLEVDQIFSNNKLEKISSLKKLNYSQEKSIEIGILCNSARREKDNLLGDPTEIALITLAEKYGYSKENLTLQNVKLKEFEFTSNRKLMSIIRKKGNIQTSYVKGAPNFVLEKCTKELINDKITLISKKRRKELEKYSLKMEDSGLRVLGLAFKQIPGKNLSIENAENNLIFSGFVGMIDPPRPEVKEAIKQAKEAGIEIKVITGDSALTTRTICNKLGLYGEIIEGRELEKLSNEDFYKIVKQKTIFARVTPEQKLQIVEKLKEQNQIVAVTGDGVNDILALKKADIGISMGVRGSDIARESSDMVLLDDNFASIVKAIRQGRRVFENLKKSIMFLLSVNVANIFIIMYSILLKIPLPFLPLAILWMNIVTDSLPALALAVEPEEENIMKKKPRKDGLLSGSWKVILASGILNFLIVIPLFYYSLDAYGVEIARTIAISMSIFYAMFFILSCKSEESILKSGILNNKYLLYTIIFSISIHLIALYTPLAIFFEFVPLNLNQLLISIIAGFPGLLFFEVGKLIKRK